MLSLYSLIWTFLISCPMLLLIFILRRRSDYLTKYGVTFISILYIFCTVRMLFPIEFPSHQKVICDPYLFSFIMKVYADLGPSGRRTALYVIVGIWMLGSIIAFLRKNREWNKVKGYLIKGASKGDGVAERILERIDSECPITIEYNLAIAEPFIRGLRHPVIYLPEKECNEKELEFILMHEYLHWKRKDLWKKFIINIIGMIFWWNPLAYLLCKDLDQIIELNCDNAMSKKYSEMDTLYYLDTLTYMAGGRRANFDKVSSDTLGFVKKLEVRPLKQRFHYVMFKKDDKRTQRKMNLFILGVSVIWFVASYYFILQPDYSIPQMDVQEDNTPFNADDENSYLEEQKDGSYIFHYAGFTDKVSKEDVESGGYEGYPIIKYKEK